MGYPARFFETKLSTYKPTNKKTLAFHKSTAKTRLLLGGKRCLPSDYKVLKSNGEWTTIENINIGDEVLGVDLTTLQAIPSKVIDKSRSGKKIIYNIELRDGTSCRASIEHDFPVFSERGRKKISKCTVEKLLTTKSKNKGLMQASTVIFNNQNSALPIDPYVLGILLGSGHFPSNGKVSITNKDERILSVISPIIEKMGCKIKTQGATHKFVTTGQSNPLPNIIKSLGLCGKRYGSRFVPKQYLIASVEDRKKLLAGLIDTNDDEYRFISKSKQLAEDFCFLIRSLGGRATLTESEYKFCNTGKSGKYYTVYWLLACRLPLAIPRKSGFRKPDMDFYRRVITDIKAIGEQECYDITIDHKDHCFIGENWVVTGNSSKSTSAVVETLWAGLGIHPFNLYPPPPLWIRYCSVDFTNGIKGIVLPMFREWGGDLNNGPIFKKYWSEDRILEFHNGTTIDMKSYDQDLVKFEGVPRHLVVEDEIPPRDIHQSNFLRTVSSNINGKIIITGTPLHGLDWVYDDLYDNPEAVPPAVEYWHIRTDENPYISQEAIEAVKADPSMRDNLEAALYGEFVPKSGLVFKSYSDKNVIPPFKVTEDHMILVGIDPHDRNPWGVVFVALNRENEYIVYDEILQAGTVSEIGPLIKEKLKGRTPQMCVIDTIANTTQATSGRSIKDQLLSSYGLYCVDANKDVSAGVLQINSLLDPGKDVRPKLFVAENCVHIRRQIKRCVWEDWARNRNNKDPKERILKKDDHLLDALRYVVMLPVVYRHPGYRAIPKPPGRVSQVTGYF